MPCGALIVRPHWRRGRRGWQAMTQLEIDIRKMLMEGGVSFAQLQRIEGFNGDRVLACPDNLNIELWGEVSREAEEILQRVLDEGDYALVSTHPLTYLIDGVTPSLPIAKSLTRAYAKPHWYPMVFVKRDEFERWRTQR
jgi:hypothetical protein